MDRIVDVNFYFKRDALFNGLVIRSQQYDFRDSNSTSVLVERNDLLALKIFDPSIAVIPWYEFRETNLVADFISRYAMGDVMCRRVVFVITSLFQIRFPAPKTSSSFTLR